MNHKVILYVDVLVKFRKEPVALAGDASQMYHQILADQWTGTFIDSCTSPWAVRIQQRFMILRGLFLEGVGVLWVRVFCVQFACQTSQGELPIGS